MLNNCHGNLLLRFGCHQFESNCFGHCRSADKSSHFNGCRTPGATLNMVQHSTGGVLHSLRAISSSCGDVAVDWTVALPPPHTHLTLWEPPALATVCVVTAVTCYVATTRVAPYPTPQESSYRYPPALCHR
ncbi:hypothetical protein C0Q70_17124 [Pomacea canaliculata]|uniref:Uncharacterized protein n=1 Tax=Pomacea canaliculata TaxID=400727 RepID=A0A2T7NRP6_POMCA|nr:hypothetical protein C0Q70_17124 [Pomacea canaliculata]